MKEGDTVLVTGRIISEPGKPRVHELRAVVASCGSAYPDEFKLWPLDDADPQLPPGHDGKLWFRVEDATVRVIAEEDA